MHRDFMPEYPFLFDDECFSRPAAARRSAPLRRPAAESARAENVIGVGAAVARIRGVLGGMLGGLWISGEVSNLSMPASGHAYFTIKDRDASIRCAYFAGSARRHPATFRTGDRIEVTGAVDVYAKSGDLQIKISDWRHAGAGALYEAYLRLKARLSAEGLFADALKKPLPFFVRRAVVVTSAQAAALQDVRRTIARRTPWVELQLAAAYVQGELAPASLMAALDCADAAGADVILLVRGGGSFEDLSAFNDERLVRKLRTLKTPVIAGIGHESDETLAGLAADVCASTPTAAAEHVSQDIHYWRSLLDEFERCLTLAVGRMTDDASQTLDQLESRLRRQDGFLVRLEADLVRSSMLLERLAGGSLQGRGARLEAAGAGLAGLGRLPERRSAALEGLSRRLRDAADGMLGERSRRLERSALCLQSPDAVLRAKTARLSALDKTLERVAERACGARGTRLAQAELGLAAGFRQSMQQKGMELKLLERRLPDMERRLDEASLRLRALGHALAGLDPDKPLRLGYARIERKDGTVSSAAEIAPGDELTLCFADGARRAVAK